MLRRPWSPLGPFDSTIEGCFCCADLTLLKCACNLQEYRAVSSLSPSEILAVGQTRPLQALPFEGQTSEKGRYLYLLLLGCSSSPSPLQHHFGQHLPPVHGSLPPQLAQTKGHPTTNFCQVKKCLLLLRPQKQAALEASTRVDLAP